MEWQTLRCPSSGGFRWYRPSRLLALRGLKLPRKRVYQRALDIWAVYSFLDFEDALAVAHMEQQGLREILSYDLDFDRLAGISRVEP